MEISYNWELFKEIFFPRHCMVCNVEIDTGLVCSECRKNFLVNKVKLYGAEQKYWKHLVTIGQPLEAENIFDRVEFLYRYDGAFKEALHRVKFDNEVYLLPRLREEVKIALAASVSKLHRHYDFITCIPTTKDRYKQRGFDVPWELFKYFGKYKCYTYNILQRLKSTAPLYSMTEIDRRAELEGCFSIFDKGKIIDKRILLCDDILTTGSTTKEAAQVLLNTGAKSVGVLAFCASKDNWS